MFIEGRFASIIRHENVLKLQGKWETSFLKVQNLNLFLKYLALSKVRAHTYVGTDVVFPQNATLS